MSMRATNRRVTGGGQLTFAQRVQRCFRRNNATVVFPPDNLAGVYTDSTGTTPVTAVGEVLGLMTDRSYGVGNLGAELVTNTWALAGTASYASGTVSLVAASDSAQQLGVFVSGKTYRLEYTPTAAATAGGYATFFVGQGTQSIAVHNSSNVARQSTIFKANSTDKLLIIGQGTGYNGGFSGISVKEVLGNHATQATTASKPTLTRVPKRLGPELVSNGDFSGGATGWAFAGGSIAAGVATWAGSAADLSQPISVNVGKDYAVTFAVTAYTAGAGVGIHNGVGPFIRGSLARRVAVGTYTEYLTATQSGNLIINGAFSAAQGASIDNISVREVLEWSYAVSFDGSNDSLALGSVPFQMSDDHCVISGFVWNGGGSANKTVVEPAGTATTTPARAAQIGLEAGTNFIQAQWITDAPTVVAVKDSTAAVAGVPYVVSARAIGNNLVLRKNAVQKSTGAKPSGTATFSGATIGSRGIASNEFFQGQITAVVICKATVSDADLALMEKWIGSLQGQTL